MCVDIIVAMVWCSFIVKRFWILLNITVAMVIKLERPLLHIRFFAETISETKECLLIHGLRTCTSIQRSNIYEYLRFNLSFWNSVNLSEDFNCCCFTLFNNM
jgi:hypothetical protein